MYGLYTMKKFIYIILLAFPVMFAVSCNDDNLSRDGEGSVMFNITCTDTRAEVTDALLEKLTFRIKSVINGVESLVRSYSGTEIKDMELWLVPGNYNVYVDGGDKETASFDKIYYKGSADFEVKAGVASNVNVICYPDNVMIKVVFDDTIKSMVADDKMTDVKAGIVFKKSDDDSIAAPSLEYTCVKGTEGVVSSGVGYFILDNGQDALEWSLSAKDVAKDKDVAKSGSYTPTEGFKTGYVYTLKFKYSADLGGYINIAVKVDKADDLESIDQDVYFKPAPQFSGNVVDKTLPVYAGMSDVEYTIKAINELTSTTGKSVKVMIDGVEITDGITTTYSEDKKECTLTLGKNFTDKLKIGSNTFRIIATDNTGAQTTYTQKYVGEGVEDTDVNEWRGTAIMKAYVVNTNATDVKVQYRKPAGSGDWVDIAATSTSDYVYKVEMPINGESNVEYKWVYTSSSSGIELETKNFSTAVAPQIPNGGMEDWGTVGDGVLVPYSTPQYWDCGNHGSKAVGKNVTTNDGENKYSGNYSAKLQSQFAGVAGFGKFAAGNIFVGKYIKTNTSTMSGEIDYGQKFNFEYKPKALRVWYKGKIGVVTDYTGGGVNKNESDKAQIYVWLCNWTGPHRINTADTSTFVKPTETSKTKEGNVIAYGEWHRVKSDSDDGSDKGWTELVIPITYREGEGFSDVIPNYLVISCAASAYGDYFAGSTDSYMYVDDFEFVY